MNIFSFKRIRFINTTKKFFPEHLKNKIGKFLVILDLSSVWLADQQKPTLTSSVQILRKKKKKVSDRDRWQESQVNEFMPWTTLMMKINIAWKNK